MLPFWKPKTKPKTKQCKGLRKLKLNFEQSFIPCSVVGGCPDAVSSTKLFLALTDKGTPDLGKGLAAAGNPVDERRH
jgi:hypothetical protein